MSDVTREEVEAAAKADWEHHWPEIPWDKVDESIRQDVIDGTRAALEAAAKVRRERVVMVNKSELPISLATAFQTNVPAFSELLGGEELVIRPAGGKEEEREHE